jgi:hypothetical protein
MRPIRTVQSNFTYHAPPGMRECEPLPVVRTSDGRTVSVWEPTPEQRRAIAEGANIELHVWMQPPPPVGLLVTGLGEFRGLSEAGAIGHRRG